MGKRKATPLQKYNLAKGREKLFQNQLRQKGINPNPSPQIIREIIRQPVVNPTTTHVHPIKIQLSLFEKFLGTKFFPIEINKNKESLNLKELINHLLARLNLHWQKIISNKSKIEDIISYLNSKEQEDNKKFNKLEKGISDLEKEKLNEIEEENEK